MYTEQIPNSIYRNKNMLCNITSAGYGIYRICYNILIYYLLQRSKSYQVKLISHFLTNKKPNENNCAQINISR